MDKLNPNNQIRPDMDPYTEPLSFSSEQDRAYSPEPDPAPVREELLRDLDRYISENWIPSVPDASGDQVPAELPSIAAREEVRPADGHFPNQKEKLLPKSGGRHSVPAGPTAFHRSATADLTGITIRTGVVGRTVMEWNTITG